MSAKLHSGHSSEVLSHRHYGIDVLGDLQSIFGGEVVSEKRRKRLVGAGTLFAFSRGGRRGESCVMLGDTPGNTAYFLALRAYQERSGHGGHALIPGLRLAVSGTELVKRYRDNRNRQLREAQDLRTIMHSDDRMSALDKQMKYLVKNRPPFSVVASKGVSGEPVSVLIAREPENLPRAARTLAEGYEALAPYYEPGGRALEVARALGTTSLTQLNEVWSEAMKKPTAVEAGRQVLALLA